MTRPTCQVQGVLYRCSRGTGRLAALLQSCVRFQACCDTHLLYILLLVQVGAQQLLHHRVLLHPADVAGHGQGLRRTSLLFAGVLGCPQHCMRLAHSSQVLVEVGEAQHAPYEGTLCLSHLHMAIGLTVIKRQVIEPAPKQGALGLSQLQTCALAQHVTVNDAHQWCFSQIWTTAATQNDDVSSLTLQLNGCHASLFCGQSHM